MRESRKMEEQSPKTMERINDIAAKKTQQKFAGEKAIMQKCT